MPLAERLEPAVANDILNALVETRPPEGVLLVVAERLCADAVLTLNVKGFARFLPQIQAIAPPDALVLPSR